MRVDDVAGNVRGPTCSGPTPESTGVHHQAIGRGRVLQTMLTKSMYTSVMPRYLT